MHRVATHLAALAMTAAGPALAEGDLSRANIIEVVIELGADENGMYIKPEIAEFVTGQAYKLLLVNTDDIKHELALNAMGERIFTRKIEMKDGEGNMMTEVKGTIREVEVGPGYTVEWYIVPVQTVDAAEITCEIDGHYEAGMFTEVAIK